MKIHVCKRERSCILSLVKVSLNYCALYSVKVDFILIYQAQGLEQFKAVRLSIFNLWEELEKTPETEFEKDLARHDSEASFVMSKNNLNAMKELKAKVGCVLYMYAVTNISVTRINCSCSVTSMEACFRILFYFILQVCH